MFYVWSKGMCGKSPQPQKNEELDEDSEEETASPPEKLIYTLAV